MKVGDLVSDNRIAPFTVGLVIGWYDTPNNMVTVAWWQGGELVEMNPCHISQLEVLSKINHGEVINESR